MILKDILGMFIEPVASVLRKREERKLVKVTVEGKLAEAAQQNAAEITFKDQELEHILAAQKANSWTDEYATVSLLSILNLIVVGGILAAFGYSQVLAGIGLAVTSLVNAGVDVGFLMEAVTLSAVGLSVWRKLS